MSMSPDMYRGLINEVNNYIESYNKAFPTDGMCYYSYDPVELMKEGKRLYGKLELACNAKDNKKYLSYKIKLDKILNSLEQKKYRSKK